MQIYFQSSSLYLLFVFSALRKQIDKEIDKEKTDTIISAHITEYQVLRKLKFRYGNRHFVFQHVL